MSIAKSLPREQIKRMQAENDTIEILKLVCETTLRA